MIKHLMPLRNLLFTACVIMLLSCNMAVAHNIIPQPDRKPQPQPQPPDPCEGQGPCCKPGPGTGENIVFRSGNETFSRTDMVVNGVYPITISRTYASQAQYDSPLGYGWAFNFAEDRQRSPAAARDG